MCDVFFICVLYLVIAMKSYCKNIVSTILFKDKNLWSSIYMRTSHFSDSQKNEYKKIKALLDERQIKFAIYDPFNVVDSLVLGHNFFYLY